MQKTFDIEIDCAVCALKCEEAIKKVNGVRDCSVNYMLQRLTVSADDVDAVMGDVLKAARRVEPDFEILN